ncbi:MAG: RNA polymerase sigma factor [Bacteroidales bacterium]|nr:RNA polymerase sigma factor [Bacteroidales bacterium]MBN2758284.1 RNA polymerase sigma factor [Bacteroidales bacterium]
MEKNTDERLISLLKESKNKDKVFELIVEEYKERLYWHIRKIVIEHDDADDILQNTFIKAWKSIENFRAESKIFTWLYRISTNESLTFLQKKKRRNIFSFQTVEKELADSLESDVYFSGDEIQLKLQKAILQLPDKQRIVFNMKYFDEIKYSEMSEILQTSEGALKASYHHAVKKIEGFLKND